MHTIHYWKQDCVCNSLYYILKIIFICGVEREKQKPASCMLTSKMVRFYIQVILCWFCNIQIQNWDESKAVFMSSAVFYKNDFLANGLTIKVHCMGYRVLSVCIIQKTIHIMGALGTVSNAKIHCEKHYI